MSQSNIEDVLRKMSATLNRSISDQSNPILFGDLMSSAGFLAETTAKDINSIVGITNYDKVNKIMCAVSSHFTDVAHENITQEFDRFVQVLRDDMRMEDLAKQLLEKLRVAVQDFQILQTENLTPAQIKELKSRLISEFMSIREDFNVLVVKTLEELERVDGCIKKLKSLIQHSDDHRPLLELFVEADDICTLFYKFSDYWSFFDYELLRMFIKRFGNVALKHEMEQYLTRLEEFCYRQLTEVPKTVKTKSTEKNIEVFVKIDQKFSGITMSEVKILEHELEEMIKTKLCLLKINDGCILLTFGIVESIMVFSLSVDQKHQLFKLRVLEICDSKNIIYYRRSDYPFNRILEASDSDRGSITIDVCKDCFYMNRTKLDIHCNHCDLGDKVCVKWNSKEERYETTEASIRPIPDSMPIHVNHVAMCDPRRGWCKKDLCTFAHGQAELRTWNRLLKSTKEQQDSSWSFMKRHEDHMISVVPSPYLNLRAYHIGAKPIEPLYFPSTSTPLVKTQKQQLSTKRNVMSRRRTQDPSKYAASKEKFPERVRGVLEIGEIEESLNRQNYKKKFHNLVCWEEKKHIQILRDKCDQICHLNIYSQGYKPKWLSQKDVTMRYGFFLNLNGDQIAYATQASEGAFIVSNQCGHEAEMKLAILRENYEHSDEKLYVAFSEHQSSELGEVLFTHIPKHEIRVNNVNVEFEVKHSYFNNLVKAVNDIHSIVINRIVPCPKDFLSFDNCSDEYLTFLLNDIPSDITIKCHEDQDQFKALQKILRCDRRSPPVIINGPFGTGKTRLLAVTTHCVIQHGRAEKMPVRVLVCAHHQASADNFIDKYFGHLSCINGQNFELVRLVSRKFYRQNFSHFYKSVEDLNFQKIPQYLVIVTTFLTAPSLLKSFETGIFTHIFLDEGSQAREPESIAPLSLAGTDTKIVIAGDSKQVGPSLLVLGEEARENGLKYSLLQRLQNLYMQYGGTALQHLVSLNTNYRCHEDIVKIPNQLFYDFEVKSFPHNASTHARAKYPLVFVCSSLVINADHKLEAKVLLKQAQKYISSWPYTWGDKDLKKICLATASRTQLVTTRHLARSKFNSLQSVRILTTYDIQGQEFEAVFLSTTEPVDPEGNTANPTKSPCDPYVFNTILTRSKSLVVVVGSPLALLGIEEHMKKLYGKMASCWIEPSKARRLDFSLALKARVFGNEATSLSDDMSLTSKSALKTYLEDVSSTQRSVVIKQSAETKQHGSHFTGVSPVTDKAEDLNSQSWPDLNSFVQKGCPAHMIDSPVYSPSRESSNVSLSSPNIVSVVTPSKCSPFYKKYIHDLDFKHREEISAENYKEKFHHLLCWEEKEHIRILAERCHQNYAIYIFQSNFIPDGLQSRGDYVRFGYIDSSNDGNKLAHAKQASHGSYIILDNHSYVYANHVHAWVPLSANYSAIIIAFDEAQHNKLTKSAVYSRNVFNFTAEVRFELKHYYFTGLHQAISHLPWEMIRRLIPTEEVLYSAIKTNPFKKSSNTCDYDQLKLDKLQTKALNRVLESKSPLPVLLAGPFGTGKTRLLARAAYEILKESKRRVLICAHHQTSVDTFVEYFGAIKRSKKHPWQINMIRVIATDAYQSRTRKKYGIYFKSKLNLSVKDFGSNRLFITTYSTASSLYQKIPGESPARKREFFTDFLLDEGAQTREPETVGPLAPAGPEARIVLSGDHCQVGPKLLVLGNEAQAHGLGTSLLERLHAYYQKWKFPSKVFRFLTLLTNYRSHSGILMLPSSLYYQSTILCGGKNDIPHPDSTFPLTFVCSDIEVQAATGVDASEADVLIKEVSKYFQKWPKNWAHIERRICIVSSSPNQCSVIKKRIRKIQVECEIEVLPSYSIQGTEFPAIFISTTEPTTESFDSISPTKSMCDRFVFNTTITRSKLLVVAVGNPFLLLKMERNIMENHDFNPEYRTWSPYVKQCIDCETFSFAQSRNISHTLNFEEVTHQLYDRILSFEDPGVQTPKSRDSIIEAYNDVFESLPESKLILSAHVDAGLAWSLEKIEAYNAQKQEKTKGDYEDQYFCTLRINSDSEAEAVPCDDSSKSIVKIQGEKNRRGAFDEERVLVGVFKNNSPAECYGCVLEAERTEHDLNFVCEVSPECAVIFYPLDNKNPKFINLPGLSRVLLRKNIGEEIESSDIESTNVVVFDLKLSERLPKIKQVIPLSIAVKMYYLVSFVRWNTKYSSPLGIVVGACNKRHTLYNTECLLKFMYSVEYDSNVQGDSEPCDAQVDANLKFYDRAFTIDVDQAQYFEDAFSVIPLGKNSHGHEVYRLCVHIVNAAKHVQPNTEVDRTARKNGVSVFGFETGKIMHMLPNPESRHMLSLIPGKVRDVISVVCDITVVDASTMHFEKSAIISAQVKSAIQLTYKQAQDVINGSIPKGCNPAVDIFDENEGELSLCRSLELLYNMALFQRKKRFSALAAFVYDHTRKEEASCWQAHLLVKELLTWANSEVAKHVQSILPELSLLQKKASDIQGLQTDVDEDQRMKLFSLYFSEHLLGSENLGPPNLDVELSPDIIEKIAIAACDIVHTESAPSSYPKYSLQQKRTRYDTSSLKKVSVISPMSRYRDIEVQRLLLHSGDKLHSSSDRNFLKHLSAMEMNASKFHRNLANARLATNFRTVSYACTSVVCFMKEDCVQLKFSDINHNPKTKTSTIAKYSLRVSSLNGTIMRHFHELDSVSAPIEGADLVAFYTSNDTNSTLQEEYFKVSELSSVQFSSSVLPEVVDVPGDPTKERMGSMRKVWQQVPSPSSSVTYNIQTCNYNFLEYNIAASLKELSVSPVWLSCSIGEPMLSPAIQLVEVSPLLRICVQHESHPVECFSDVNLLLSLKKQYNSLEEYIDLWKKLIIAEAAQKSVKLCQPVIIRDVVLHWPEIKFTKNFMKELSIYDINMIIPEIFINDCYEFFKICVGDLICVRYGCNSTKPKTVFHFVVHGVNEEEIIVDGQSKIVVSMRSFGTEISEVVREVFMDSCEVQVISVDVFYRNIFKGLLAIHSQKQKSLFQYLAVDYSKKDHKIKSSFNKVTFAKDEVVRYISDLFSSTKFMNSYLEEAVIKAVNSPFLLIQEPPGTEESMVGLCVVYVFAQLNKKWNAKTGDHHCVLYCSPSEKSLDNVLVKFHQMAKTRENFILRILRVYNSTIEGEDYPGPNAKITNLSGYACPEWAKCYALHHLVRKQVQLAKLREMEQELKLLRKTSKRISGKWCNEYWRVLNESYQEFLSKEKFDIIFCACSEASGMRVTKHMSPHQCIIDQCGMALEPEAIVPISLSQHAVLIGDHKQLQPAINYQPAKKMGLDISLFEKFFEDKQYVFTLRTQYRMHEAICKFPSETFYDGQLITDPSVRKFQENEKLQKFWHQHSKNLPMLFVDVIGEEGQDKIEHRDSSEESICNITEAQLVIQIVQVLHSDHEVPMDDIAILTPYSAQKRTLQKKVADMTKEFSSLKIVTISESQGNEYGIVILSTVRSMPLDDIKEKHYVQPDHIWRRKHLGYMTDNHQINVGLTRSKYGLIITGNKTLLEYDSTWKKLLQHYTHEGCLVHEPHFQSSV